MHEAGVMSALLAHIERAAGAAVHMQLSNDISDPDALFVRLVSIEVRD